VAPYQVSELFEITLVSDDGRPAASSMTTTRLASVYESYRRQMVISMTRFLCEKGLCKTRRPRLGDGSNSARVFPTAATDSALTNINAMSRIVLRCDHLTSELPGRLQLHAF
jgi:hypothetical protein